MLIKDEIFLINSIEILNIHCIHTTIFQKLSKQYQRQKKQDTESNQIAHLLVK